MQPRTQLELYKFLRAYSQPLQDGRIAFDFERFIDAIMGLREMMGGLPPKPVSMDSDGKVKPIEGVKYAGSAFEQLQETKRLLNDRYGLLKLIVLTLWPATQEPLMGEVLESLPAEIAKLKRNADEFGRILDIPDRAATPLDERVRLIYALRRIIEITDSASTQNPEAKACRSAAVRALYPENATPAEYEAALVKLANVSPGDALISGKEPIQVSAKTAEEMGVGPAIEEALAAQKPTLTGWRTKSPLVEVVSIDRDSIQLKLSELAHRIDWINKASCVSGLTRTHAEFAAISVEAIEQELGFPVTKPESKPGADIPF